LIIIRRFEQILVKAIYYAINTRESAAIYKLDLSLKLTLNRVDFSLYIIKINQITVS